MKCEIPDAAVVRNDAILCTRCAALVGSSMTHHMRNATAAHPSTVFNFTAASLGALTSPFLAVSPYRSLNPAWWGPSRRDPGCPLCSVLSAGYPEHWSATHAPSREYAAPRRSLPPRAADRKQPRRHNAREYAARPDRGRFSARPFAHLRVPPPSGSPI
jgi:hypothetical protein